MRMISVLEDTGVYPVSGGQEGWSVGPWLWLWLFHLGTVRGGGRQARRHCSVVSVANEEGPTGVLFDAKGFAMGESDGMEGLEGVGEVGRGGSWERRLYCLPDLTWARSAA